MKQNQKLNSKHAGVADFVWRWTDVTIDCK